MEGVGNDRRDLVRAIFEQHSAQIRQWENQRLIVAVVAGIIFAGALILVPEFYAPAAIPIMIMLELFAVFAFFHAVSLSRRIADQIVAAEVIIGRHSLTHYLPAYRMRHPRIFSPGGVVTIFPLLLFSGGLAFLLEMILESLWLIIAIPCLALIGGIVFMAMGRSTPPLPPAD